MARSLTPDTALSAKSTKQMLQVALPVRPSGVLAILMRLSPKFERKAWREGSGVPMSDLDISDLSNVGIRCLEESGVQRIGCDADCIRRYCCT